MRLRKPCEHDRYEAHATGSSAYPHYDLCPGGEFLPEDALVIERDSDGEWPEWAQRAVSFFLELDEEGSPTDRKGRNPRALDELALAADQVGEPG